MCQGLKGAVILLVAVCLFLVLITACLAVFVPAEEETDEPAQQETGGEASPPPTDEDTGRMSEGEFEPAGQVEDPEAGSSRCSGGTTTTTRSPAGGRVTAQNQQELDCAASEGGALMEKAATSDAAWLDQTASDNLDYEESLAEAPDSGRYLLRGFNTRQQVDMPWWDIDRALDEMVRANSNIHRLLIYWTDVQPNNAYQWHWGKYDSVIDKAALRGMRLVLTPTGSPNWARKAARWTDTSDRYHAFAYPDNLPAWGVFVSELAKRYGAYAFEIWNEPNLRRFWEARPLWSTRGPSPSGWTELYCRAATRIKAVNPGALVSTGGLAAETSTGWNWAAGRFLKRAFAVGLGACPLDLVAYHPYAIKDYCESDPPMDASLPPFQELRRVRGTMINNGYGSRGISMTEWGFPSVPFEKCTNYSERRQADLIAREHAYLRSLPYSRHSMYFNSNDQPSDFHPWSSIGVLRSDWSRKPGFYTFASLP